MSPTNLVFDSKAQTCTRGSICWDDFRTFLGEPAHLIWWHPPYWDMIQYSGEQWGEPHKWI